MCQEVPNKSDDSGHVSKSDHESDDVFALIREKQGRVELLRT